MKGNETMQLLTFNTVARASGKSTAHEAKIQEKTQIKVRTIRWVGKGRLIGIAIGSEQMLRHAGDTVGLPSPQGIEILAAPGALVTLSFDASATGYLVLA